MSRSTLIHRLIEAKRKIVKARHTSGAEHERLLRQVEDEIVDIALAIDLGETDHA